MIGGEKIVDCLLLQQLAEHLLKPFKDLADAAKPILSRVIHDLIDNYAGRPWAYGEDHDAITCDYIPPQDAWRIKVKEGPADHRIYFDLADDNTLVFLTVYHKDDE